MLEMQLASLQRLVAIVATVAIAIQLVANIYNLSNMSPNGRSTSYDKVEFLYAIEREMCIYLILILQPPKSIRLDCKSNYAAKLVKIPDSVTCR